MILDEMITRLSIIANIKACKKQDKEANETLQLMNWLIELKNFKKEEQEKIRLLENIIIKKDVEIRDLSRKLAKWEVPGIER
ncbi:hypothetical protein C0L77_000555 [Clostridium perfringens]